MSHYPNGSFYTELYARYFDQSKMIDLIELAGDLSNKVVIDLCGGTGRLAQHISHMYSNATVILVDESYKMMSEYDGTMVEATVNEFFRTMIPYTPDVVYCQQAINYWFNREDIQYIYDSFKPGGVFIFNTFSVCPSEIPVIKKYELNNYQFMEISWYVPETNLVHHVQIREGMPPHVTSFQWIPKELFISTLEQIGFLVNVIERGASLTIKAMKE